MLRSESIIAGFAREVSARKESLEKVRGTLEGIYGNMDADDSKVPQEDRLKILQSLKQADAAFTSYAGT